MRARRVDANHAEIAAAFRQLGYSVADTSRLGSGFPDLVIAKGRRTVLVEIKDGRKSPSKRRLTPDEQAFADAWRGEYRIVSSVDHVMALAGDWTNEQ